MKLTGGPLPMRDYKVKTIRALDRGLAVLAHLHLARAASLHDLYLATGLPKATLTRLLLTLERRGMIWQRLADGAYMTSHVQQPRAPRLSDENYLVEVASPVMARLCRNVNWPSVLAVPRLDCMEVIETNRPKSYFSNVPVGPIGFRINLLRSASGRAYLAFCSESERQAMLQRLAASTAAGNFMARKPAMVDRLLEETRRLGYGHRTPDFGGHFDQTRREWNDDRDSIAVPVWVNEEVIASLNLTWMHKVSTVQEMVKAHLPLLTAAAREISTGLVAD